MQNDLNISRSYFYEFLARAISFMNEKDYAILQEQAKFFYESFDECKDDFAAILDTDFCTYKAEQNAVFYDFSYVNVPFDASFYDEGRDNGKMRIISIGIMRRANLIKNDAKISDNEDSFNFLFFMASELARRGDNELLGELFSRVINEVVDEFSAKLRTHKDSQIFSHIANIIDFLVSIERAFFSLNAPQKDTSVADAALSRVPYEPRLPSKFSKINMEEVTAFKGEIE